MPCVELEGEKDIQFEVKMSSLPVNTRTGVAHLAKHVSSGNTLPLLYQSGGKVGIEAKEWALAPVVFDDDVFPVIATPGTFLNVNNASKCDRSNVVEGAPCRIPLYGADIDSLVKPGRDYSLLCSSEGSDKAVTSALPGLACFALKGAINIHIELFRVALQKCPVVGW